MPSEERRPPIRVRRLKNRQKQQAQRERAARTPKAKAITAFDRWRRNLINLPPIYADQEAEEMAALIRERAIRIEPVIEESTDDDC